MVKRSGYPSPGPLDSRPVRTSLGLLVVLACVSPAWADEVSNPAFLGIGMRGGPGEPCMITSVTKDSGASLAGLREADVVTHLDTTPITSCDSLVNAIQTREPGQVVKIEVRRGGTLLTLEANLPSRADVLRKRFVGKPLPLTTLIRVDNQKVADVSSRGKTTIMGWFLEDGCTTCASAFSSIEQWVKDSKLPGISVVGVTASDRKSMPEMLADLKKVQRSFDVPLLATDTDTFGEISITDNKRIHFLVIDCRGVVSYAAPLKPDADDRTAVLEELFAATEQAARRMK